MERKLFEPNMIKSLLIYVVVMFLGSALIMYAFSYIASLMSNTSVVDIIAALDPKNESTPEALTLSISVFAWSTTLMYVILAASVPLYTRDALVDDAKKIKKSPIKFVIGAIISTALFYGLLTGIDELIERFADTPVSNNQGDIEQMIKAGYAWLLFVPIVILAPIVEELVYRKAIFKVFERNNIIAFIFSVVAFVLPHMLSTETSAKDWIIISLPYFASAIMLATIYLCNKKNVYVTILVHIVNNLLAFILVVI